MRLVFNELVTLPLDVPLQSAVKEFCTKLTALFMCGSGLCQNPYPLAARQQRLAALAHWHAEHGFVDPTRAPLVRKVLTRIQN